MELTNTPVNQYNQAIPAAVLDVIVRVFCESIFFVDIRYDPLLVFLARFHHWTKKH
jgi:hypothetical protein